MLGGNLIVVPYSSRLIGKLKFYVSFFTGLTLLNLLFIVTFIDSVFFPYEGGLKLNEFYLAVNSKF